MAVGVFEGKRVWVSEVGSDEEMDLSWEGCECWSILYFRWRLEDRGMVGGEGRRCEFGLSSCKSSHIDEKERWSR